MESRGKKVKIKGHVIISHKVVYIFLQNGGNIDCYFICIETYHTIPRVLRTLTEASNVTCFHFQLGSHSFYQPKASYIESRVLSTLIEASKVTWYHFQLGIHSFYQPKASYIDSRETTSKNPS